MKCGKDLTDSVTQSGRIAQVLGGRRPEGLIYELFLDEKGEKISKSKGNGLTIEQWLDYGSEESLSPVPRTQERQVAPCRDHPARGRRILAVPREAGQPAHRAATGQPGLAPAASMAPETTPRRRARRYCRSPMASCSTWSGCWAPMPREQVWSYLANYVDNADPAAHPALDALVTCALAYNRDFIAPTLARRKPEGGEAALPRSTRNWPPARKTPAPKRSRTWSTRSARTKPMALRPCATGSRRSTKPCSAPRRARMGSFIVLYGVANTRRLIAEALAA
jgi:lysyl-tRNA synthetase class 1